MAKNILICDDAAFMRMMIKDILTKNGYTVVGEAENGAKAIEKYAELKPDLVLMDISKENPTMEILCEHNTSWLSHNVHCHPTWSWSNDKILFASDRDKLGCAQLYMVNMKGE